MPLTNRIHMKEYSAQKIVEKIRSHSELTNKKILEIGSGDGRISSLLSEECNSLVAIDPDENAINRAKANSSTVDFKVGSGERLIFPNRFFDLVIFTLSLHHQHSQKALGEAERVAKADGRIIVVEPVIDGEIERVFAFLHNENNEKIQAQKAIMDSGLSMVASEIFTANWVFEDEDDLLFSLFEHYDMPFDSDIAVNVSNFLGPKVNATPIVLVDKMIIQILKIGGTERPWPRKSSPSNKAAYSPLK